jgi:hypothetical protein
MEIDEAILTERVKEYLEKMAGIPNRGGVHNSFTLIIQNAYTRRSLIGKPLPWIESAINMPYLNAMTAFVLGLSLSAIDTMTLSLEFTFRLALKDWNNSTGFHEIDTSKLTKNKTWSELFKDNHNEDSLRILIPDAADREWWKNSVILRNKINHFDIKYLINSYKKLGYPDIPGMIYDGHGSDYKKSATWGAIFHRLIDALAETFMPKANSMLQELINHTKWPQPKDESTWGSHKDIYNDFFAIDWRPLHLQAMLETFIKGSPSIIRHYYK